MFEHIRGSWHAVSETIIVIPQKFTDYQSQL
jgi:hypothetical protein